MRLVRRISCYNWFAAHYAPFCHTHRTRAPSSHYSRDYSVVFTSVLLYQSHKQWTLIPSAMSHQSLSFWGHGERVVYFQHIDTDRSINNKMFLRCEEVISKIHQFYDYWYSREHLSCIDQDRNGGHMDYFGFLVEPLRLLVHNSVSRTGLKRHMRDSPDCILSEPSSWIWWKQIQGHKDIWFGSWHNSQRYRRTTKPGIF